VGISRNLRVERSSWERKHLLRIAAGFGLAGFTLMEYSAFSRPFCRNRSRWLSGRIETRFMVLSASLLVSHCFGFQFNWISTPDRCRKWAMGGWWGFSGWIFGPLFPL